MPIDKQDIIRQIDDRLAYFESENYHSEGAMLSEFVEIIENFGDDWEENCSKLIEGILTMSPY